MKLLRIKNWNDRFENNRTRDLKEMEWVPIPNKHDGDAYRDLISREGGTALYGAWNLIVQVGSKCGLCPKDYEAALACGQTAPSCVPRGTLLRKATGTPHTAETIARQTGGDAIMIAQAISILLELQWLEEIEWDSKQTILTADVEKPLQNPALTCGNPAPSCGLVPSIPHPTDEGKERKGIEEKTTTPQPPAGEALRVEDAKASENKSPQIPFIAAWNALGKPFAQIEDWNSKRAKLFKARWNESYFREHWQEALTVMQRLDWCRGETDRGWVAGVEYFLRVGSVTTLIEQKGRTNQRVIGRKMSEEQRNNLYEGIPT